MDWSDSQHYHQKLCLQGPGMNECLIFELLILINGFSCGCLRRSTL